MFAFSATYDTAFQKSNKSTIVWTIDATIFDTFISAVDTANTTANEPAF